MRNGKRGRYTPEFKQEGVRLVESGLSIPEAARSLGDVEQTLSNWVRAHGARKLQEVRGKSGARRSRWRSAVCERSWRG
jgi:transposase